MSLLYPSPSSACSRLRELFAKEIHSGMSQADYLAFCSSRGWKTPTYDKLDNRYIKLIPVSKGDDGQRHSVVITVWLTEERKVKSYEIHDSYTGL